MAMFSDRMKELRAQNDYTMDYVVESMNKKYGTNLTRSHISRYENGQTQPSIVIFSYFCKFYNVSADFLLGLTDSPEKKNGDPATWKNENIVVNKNGDKIKAKVKKK